MLESDDSSKQSHKETEETPPTGRQGGPSESRGACGTPADEKPGKPATIFKRWEANSYHTLSARLCFREATWFATTLKGVPISLVCG